MSKPLDRLALLETFVRISERGSISRAARDLGLSQGSASRQLKDLEDRLGVQLIRRTTHSLVLTEAGLEVLSDARELLGRWTSMEEQLAGDGGDLQGSLRIVAPVALGQLQLADVAIAFQIANPKVALNWRLEDEPIRFAEVGCDCWIKVGPVLDDTLIVRRLARIERMITCTPELAARMPAADPPGAEGLPFATLAPFEGAKIRLFNADAERHDLQVASVLSTNNIMALKRAVQRGIGAAVLPRWFVADELATGSLVDALPDWRAATLDLNVAFLPARRQPRRLSAFLDMLAARIGSIPGLLRVSNDA